MLMFLVIGFIQVAWAMWFFYNEWEYFWNHVQSIPSWSVGDKFAYPFKFIGSLPHLFPLVLDITITVFFAGSLGFGGGVMGGVTGLFASNILSCILAKKIGNPVLPWFRKKVCHA